jgi:hypothetical protein
MLLNPGRGLNSPARLPQDPDPHDRQSHDLFVAQELDWHAIGTNVHGIHGISVCDDPRLVPHQTSLAFNRIQAPTDRTLHASNRMRMSCSRLQDCARLCAAPKPLVVSANAGRHGRHHASLGRRDRRHASRGHRGHRHASPARHDSSRQGRRDSSQDHRRDSGSRPGCRPKSGPRSHRDTIAGTARVGPRRR